MPVKSASPLKLYVIAIAEEGEEDEHGRGGDYIGSSHLGLVCELNNERFLATHHVSSSSSMCPAKTPKVI